MTFNKLELHQETLKNLVPKSNDKNNVRCTLNSDFTFVVSCPHHCANPEQLPGLSAVKTRGVQRRPLFFLRRSDLRIGIELAHSENNRMRQ